LVIGKERGERVDGLRKNAIVVVFADYGGSGKQPGATRKAEKEKEDSDLTRLLKTGHNRSLS
jgi:hypothetical protein